MNTQDVLNVLLIIVVSIVLISVVAVTYFLIKALKAVTKLANSLENTTQSIKEKMTFRVLAALPAILVGLIGRIIGRRR